MSAVAWWCSEQSFEMETLRTVSLSPSVCIYMSLSCMYAAVDTTKSGCRQDPWTLLS